MNNARSRATRLWNRVRSDVRVWLIGLMLLLALAPMLITGIIGLSSLRTSLFAAEKDVLDIEHAAVAKNVGDYLKETLSLTNFASKNETIVRWASAQPQDRVSYQSAAEEQLRLLISEDPNFQSAALADLNGKQVLDAANAGQPSGVGTDISFREYYQEARSGRPYISAPILSVTTKKAAIYFAVPVFENGQRGRVAAVLRLRVDDAALQEKLDPRSEDADAENVSLQVVDRDGVIVLRSGEQQDIEGEQIRFRSLTPITPAQLDVFKKGKRYGTDKIEITPLNTSQNFLDAFGDEDISSFRYTLDGKPHYAAVAPIKITGWHIVAVASEADLNAPVARATRNFLGIALPIALAATLIALFAARQVTRPLDRLKIAASRIAGGDYDTRVPVRGEDQFAQVGSAFNGMVDQVVANARQKDEENAAMQRQVVQLLDEVSKVAGGDLTVEAEVSADALGSVADSFNYMTGELRQVIGRVNDATTQVTTSTDEILATTDVLARSAEQQAGRIADTSTAVEEMAVSIQQVSENAAISAQVAREARTAAEAGAGAVTATVAGMDRIRDQVQETAKKITRLGESSEEIGGIVSLIQEVADQTELLALNAAIQAAMAGEHGKGFGVVAEEVRRLAERTGEASKQIAALVKSIQAETAEAVAAMEEGTREVIAGSYLADEAGISLARIDQVATQLAELIEAISLASQQQARASSGIAQAMGEISTVTQSTTTGTQQASQSVAALAVLASDLRDSVATFRLGNEARPATAATGHDNGNSYARHDVPLQVPVGAGRH